MAELQTITLGGGCFWCLEPVFKPLTGVHSAVVGYAGGEVSNPTYEQVCTGRTGHAEVLQVTYDPAVITTRELLEVFFSVHDPTTRNRQGADVGPQYRSIILYSTPEQKEDAEAVIHEMNNANEWGRPLVTEVAPLMEFFPAEEYHQGYYEKNPYAGYCQVVIAPKVSKFRKQYAEKLSGLVD